MKKLQDQPKVKKTTQLQKVRMHLEEFGSITGLEAFRDYAIMRLAARIWTLKHVHGMDITKTTKTGKNRFGDEINWAKYTLRKPEEKQFNVFTHST